MTFFADYTTLYAVRDLFIGSTSEKSDDVLAQIITRTSRQIDGICQRVFAPRIATHLYDVPRGDAITLDDDLLEVLALTNGDGTAIAASAYKLYPLNFSAKHKLALVGSSGSIFLADSNGDAEGAISISAIWGYHDRYSDAWVGVGASLASGIDASTVTIAGVQTQTIRAGSLIKIDSEYLYVRDVAINSTSGDTLTVARGANGSTAASHGSSASLLVWTNPVIEDLATTAVVAYARLRDNPAGESKNVGGNVFVTPRDVQAWIAKRCASLAIVKGSFF
jgi:hypothetical protein